MSDLVPAQEFGKYTKEDIEAARNVICPQAAGKPPAPDSIIRLILYRCSQLGADPYSRMVYAVERRGVWTLQVSIDMFRATAESAGDYAGQDGPYWCGDDGVWKDVWLEKKNPRAAKVGVLRTGFAQPLYSIANWESYVSDFGHMWSKFGPLMIAKCAEALALRRAFPAKLSGLYTSDEMHQAESKATVLDSASLAYSSPQAQAAVQAAPAVKTIQDAILLPQSEIELAATRSIGRQIGKLVGAVNQDLQRLGGDVLALKAEYENALSQKNPRGAHTAAVVGEPKNPEVIAVVSGNDLPAVDGEAGTQNKTRHIMSIMQAFTHPALITEYGAFEAQMALISEHVGTPIKAYSDLAFEDAADVVKFLQAMIPAGTPATADEIKHLQIIMKDDKLVEWMKTSKTYKNSESGGRTQAESLKSARLAYATHAIGRELASFNELTSEECTKLAQAAKKQASK